MSKKNEKIGIFFICALVWLMTSTSSLWSFAPQPNVEYQIQSVQSGGLFVSSEYSDAIVLNPYQNNPNMSWVFVTSGNNLFKIKTLKLNKVISQPNHSIDIIFENESNSDAQLWSLIDVGNDFVALKNKQSGGFVSVNQPWGAYYTGLKAKSFQNTDDQKFWIEPMRMKVQNLIATSIGYSVSEPKKFILCSNTNWGTVVYGTIVGPNGSINVPFSYVQSRWGQHYYSYTDKSFAQSPGTFSVSVSGFPTSSFTVSNDIYRSVPNRFGIGITIPDIVKSFYAAQRQTDPQTGLKQIVIQEDGSKVQIGISGDVHGGWKDATSWDLENIDMALALKCLSLAVERAKNDSDRNALLSEVIYAVDFFSRFQKPDGSFPITLYPESMDGGSIVMNSDVGASAASVTALAAASRAIKNLNPTWSKKSADLALRGWEWVKNNKNAFINNDKILPVWWRGNAEDILAAALELAMSTGNQSINAEAISLFQEGSFDSSWFGLQWKKKVGSYVNQNGGSSAVVSLCRYYLTLEDGSLKTSIAEQLSKAAQILYNVLDPVFDLENGAYTSSFGGNYGVASSTMVYLSLYQAFREPKYLNTAQRIVHFLLQANPFGSSFVIGLGQVNATPQFVRPRSSSIGALVPGIVSQDEGKSIVLGSDYAGGEASIHTTSYIPYWMATIDSFVNVATTHFSIPGSIEAEDYSAMSGIQIENCSEGTKDVGWVESGDWIEFPVNVSTTGDYLLELRLASATNGGSASIMLDNQTKGSISIGNTGGWQSYQTVSTTVALNAGNQTLRLLAQSSGSGYLFNVNWIRLAKKTANPIGDYSIQYKIDNQWNNGAAVTVTLKNNTSSPIEGWTLEWVYLGNQRIENSWNATSTQTGKNCKAISMNYNRTIAPQGGTTSFGFNLMGQGANERPTGFFLNGQFCSLY